jgi:hypothetical protein
MVKGQGSALRWKKCKGHVDPCMAHGSEAHPPELVDLVHEHDGYSLVGLYEFEKLGLSVI